MPREDQLKSRNGVNIKVGQQAMVLRNEDENPVVSDGDSPPAVTDVLAVLGVVMYVTDVSSKTSLVYLQDHPDANVASVTGWWHESAIVVLQEAR